MTTDATDGVAAIASPPGFDYERAANQLEISCQSKAAIVNAKLNQLTDLVKS